MVGSFLFYFPYHNPLSYPLLLELKSGRTRAIFFLNKENFNFITR